MIELCCDKNIIKNIALHPDVREWLIDDNSPDEYEPVILPNVYYITEESRKGFIRVDPLNSVTAYVHIATMPSMKGQAHKFVKEAIEWGFKNLPFIKYVAMFPEYNENVLNLVKKFKLKKEGRLTRAFLKNWKYHDMLIYSLNKEL